MQEALLSIDLSAAWRSIDYWLSRYQPMVIGAIALWIAYSQMSIARRQSRISQQQFEMNREQRAMDEALAKSTVYAFYDDFFRVWSPVVGMCWHHGDGTANYWNWKWRPAVLPVVAKTRIPDQIEFYAAKAFPKDAPIIVGLAQAVRDVKRLAEEYAKDPWDGAIDELDEYTPRNVKMTAETSEAMNRVWHFLNQGAKFQAPDRE